jgi:hypothetical protein
MFKTYFWFKNSNQKAQQTQENEKLQRQKKLMLNINYGS